MLTLMNQLTGSTLALAAVAIALAIPPLTFGMIAGSYVGDAVVLTGGVLALALYRGVTPVTDDGPALQDDPRTVTGAPV